MEMLVSKPDERRSSSRFADQVELQIAPLFGSEFAGPEFQKVVGRDISQGGVSFFFSSVPHFSDLQIKLGKGAECVCVTAQVVSSNPVAGLEPYHLISCRFTGRAASN
jgi:hypothetical protein